MDTPINIGFEQEVRAICIRTQHFMNTGLILGDNAMLLWAVLPTFRVYLLPLFSRKESVERKDIFAAAFCPTLKKIYQVNPKNLKIRRWTLKSLQIRNYGSYLQKAGIWNLEVRNIPYNTFCTRVRWASVFYLIFANTNLSNFMRFSWNSKTGNIIPHW